MGFDINLIVGRIDEELICPICTEVLENPFQARRCEHAFCKDCIEKWLMLKKMCPVDRSPLSRDQLLPASRLMRNMLARLQIKCPFSEYECPSVMPLSEYREHVAACQFNPKAIVECQNCLMELPKDELPQHNCIFELRKVVQNQEKEISVLKQNQLDNEVRIGILTRELELLQYYIAVLRSTSPVMRNIGAQLDNYAVIHWSSSLPQGRVTNWGSVISTPDDHMRFLVRNSLRASGCPMFLLNQMVKHCHEEHWPAAMATLSGRRAHETQLAAFVIRLIRPLSTGKQCLCIFGVDNYHMPDNLRPILGMTMIFVDGLGEVGIL